MNAGEVLGLVGESRCGKSRIRRNREHTQADSATRTNLRARCCREDLLQLPISNAANPWQEIGVIFQEPMSALSPLQRIERQLANISSTYGFGSDEIRAT